jgi:hypothetical protein
MVIHYNIIERDLNLQNILKKDVTCTMKPAKTEPPWNQLLSSGYTDVRFIQVKLIKISNILSMVYT